MWLVLCGAADKAAHWAYAELRRAGLEPLHIVAEEALAMPIAFEHRLSIRGVSTRLQLASGLVINSHEIEGVLNRVVGVPALHLYQAAPPERDYALQELYALYLSWLAGLPAPVLNRPSPLGLSGPVLHASTWMALAAAAGLDIGTYCLADDDLAAIESPGAAMFGSPFAPAWAAGDSASADGRATVIVTSGRVVGSDPPAPVRGGCLALARRAGLDLMGAEFRVKGGSWRFEGATALPDLRQGGPALIDALLEVWAGSPEAGA